MGSSTANANDLGKAKRAVAATMKLKMSKLLFNQPVDPEALGLPNYFDVVKQPMDLGTIFDKLSSAERRDWQESEYESAAEVFRDVSQVWQNCVLYNSRDVDKPTRDVALDVKAAFELNWKEVGLEKAKPERQDATADCLVESSVPQTVGSVQEGLDVPVRVLEAYNVIDAATGEAADLVQAWCNTLVATGEVTAEKGSKKQKKSSRIVTGPILDWSFSYGAEPNIWICTDLAWYRLETPSPSYGELHQQLQQRLELCNASVKLVKHNSSLTPLAAAQNAFTEAHAESDAEDEQQTVIAFVEAQLSAWMEAAAGSSNKKGKGKQMSGIRLGKAGLVVSGKTAAAAAIDAAHAAPLPSAGKKRKAKGSASRNSKKQKQDDTAEEQEADGNKGKTKAGRPPKKAQADADTPTGQKLKVKLGSTTESKLSQMGKEASTKGSSKRPAPSSPASDSEEEEEEAEEKEEQEDEYKQEDGRSSVRRTRHGSVQRDTMPISRRKSKSKDAADRFHAKLSQAEQAKRDSQAAGRSRVKREKEEHAARGPVPQPCREFRLPQAQVPALLIVWELTQALGPLLQLAPLPFWRLEAAIAPGPRLPPHAPPTDPEQPAARPEQGSQQEEVAAEADQAMPKDNAAEQKDKDGSEEVHQDSSKGPAESKLSSKAAEPAQAVVKPADSGIDPAGSASTVVLRDIHCALVRLIQNQGLEKDKKDSSKGQPSTGKLFSPDSGGPVPWTALLAQSILSAPAGKAAATAKAAALKLAYMEYADLDTGERLALLQGLLEQALHCEHVRELITSKVEAMAVLCQPKKPNKDGNAPEPSKEASSNPKEVEVTAQPGSCEEWVGWMEACRVGWRKPLGYDMQRRRYWALGGSLAAWRVYVEEQEGSLWGWYEGESLDLLLSWLKAASIEREAGLLKALSQAPLPKKVPMEGHSSKHSISTDSEISGTLLSSSELEARRPDGFKFITAPLLRGEGNWPSVSLYGTLEQRILHTVDALLARIPFWLKGETWLARHAHVIQVVAAARGGGDVPKALLLVERMLMEQQMLQLHWEPNLQQPWRQGLAKCSDPRQAIMYLSALQEHMVTNCDVLPRQGFNQMARNMRCQLYFPYPAEQVILLRTGVLVHINAYMQALGLQDTHSHTPHDSHKARNSQTSQADPVQLASKSAVQSPHTAKHHNFKLSNGFAHQSEAADAGSALLHSKASALQGHDGATGDQDVIADGQSGSQADTTTAAAAAVQTEAAAAAAAVDWHGPIPAEQKDELRRVWQRLKETVEALPHVACYTIASVAYRRSLVDTLPEDKEAVVSGQQARRPVAWLLLRPVASSPVQHRQPLRALALPVSCDAALPDFIVKTDVFEKGMRRHWHQHDRFRMFFASSYGNKSSGGVYYKGTVTGVRQQMPSGGVNLKGRGEYDPWEALKVEWDVGGDAEGMDCVSPWEIENDPEEERRLLEDQRKAQEAAARAARLEAKAAKARRMTEGLDSGEEEEEPEPSPQESPTRIPSPPPQVQPVSTKPAQQPPRVVDRAAAQLIDEDIAQALAADAALLEDPLSLGEGALQPMGAGYEEGYEQPALTAGGTISKDVLDLVRGLDKQALTRLLINYYRRAKGKYKVPTFAHQELDLHKVFWEVQDKGGYDKVTNLKLWKEICRSLELDLTGQTSASYNMRLNYEKCLLEFEKYLAFGQYSADLAAGTAPPTHVLEAPPAVKPTQGTSFALAAPIPMQGTRASARLAAAGPNPFSAADELDDLSFTELLNMDLEVPDQPAAEASAPSEPEQAPGPVPNVARGPRSKRGGPHGSAPAYRLVAPNQPPGSSNQGVPAVLQGSGGPSLGSLLQGLGRRLIGKKVMRFWPDNGGWWEAIVQSYSATSGQHRLRYDEGEDEESFEWLDFRELTTQEIKQHPDHVMVQAHPTPAPRPPSAPTPPSKPSQSKAELAVMDAIMAALRSGVAPAVMHSIVDVAATALRVPNYQPPAALQQPAFHLSTHTADALHALGHSEQPVSPRAAATSPTRQPIPTSKRSAHRGRRDAGETEAREQQLHQQQAPASSAAASKSQQAEESTAPQAQSAAGPDAPYSFRRHRRMDLQPQPQPPPSLPDPPSASQPVKVSARIKLKRPPSAEPPEAEPPAATDAGAPQPPAPTRSSVRVKIRRTASGSRQDPAGPAAAEKPPSSHKKKRSTRQHQQSDAKARDDSLRPGHDDGAEDEEDEGVIAAGMTPKSSNQAEAAVNDDGDDDVGDVGAAPTSSSVPSNSGDLSELRLPSEHSAWQSQAEADHSHQADEADSARGASHNSKSSIALADVHQQWKNEHGQLLVEPTYGTDSDMEAMQLEQEGLAVEESDLDDDL